MNKTRALIQSMRLRTLPLSAGGVILGILLANADYRISPVTAALVILTTILLQILSNMSNELGDVLSGTDTADRQGPEYGLNAGLISISDFRRAIAVITILTIISGSAMVRVSFGTIFSLTPILLLMLGAAAIIAAIKYTLGRNPYGYRGLGDIYVFLFFGLVAVLGSYFVCAHTIPSAYLLLPAAAIGLFSVGVLNVNNIRDMKTDAATRTTVAIRLGEHRAKIYQAILITAGWAAMLTYCLLRFPDPWHYLWILTLPLFILHLHGVWHRSGRELDPMLPLLVSSTFLLCLLAGLGFNAYLFI